MISVTLTKAKRVFRERRAMAAARDQLLGMVEAYRGLGQERVFESNEELLDYCSSLGRGIIRAMQIRSEILSLLDEVRKLTPRRVLEVGTANGGTLFLLCQLAHPEASIISVDLPGGKFGEGYAWWRVPLYRRFTRNKQTIRLLRGNSHSLEMLESVRKIMGNQPLDFAFIDGDHSYNGVKRDFEFYGQMVRKGGLVAFHDIVEHDSPAFQVGRFWREVKQRYRHVELVNDLSQRGYGIGLLYVD